MPLNSLGVQGHTVSILDTAPLAVAAIPTATASDPLKIIFITQWSVTLRDARHPTPGGVIPFVESADRRG